MKTTLPADSAARKNYPLYTGVIRYAPAALAGMAKISKEGNDKHNPGEALHHARGKSNDHPDCVVRHSIDIADLEAALERREIPISAQDDAERRAMVEALLTEVGQFAWRAVIWSQELHEKYGGAPLAPGARLPQPAKTVEEIFGDTGRMPHGTPSRGMSEFAAERLPLDPTHD